MTDTVPAPTNLQITEVTPESFRGTWDHGASDVTNLNIERVHGFSKLISIVSASKCL